MLLFSTAVSNSDKKAADLLTSPSLRERNIKVKGAAVLSASAYRRRELLAPAFGMIETSP